MGRLRAISIVAIVAACGSSKGTPTTGPDGKSCVPGRCLEDIAVAIKPHRPEARACFDDAVKKNPALQGGRLIINLEIAPSGDVTNVSQGVQSEQITDEDVVTCVSAVLMMVRFKPAPKTVQAFHTFEFNRKK